MPSGRPPVAGGFRRVNMAALLLMVQLLVCFEIIYPNGLSETVCRLAMLGNSGVFPQDATPTSTVQAVVATNWVTVNSFN